jgi:glycerophosphoryl diester phosphodiesterase
LRAGAFAVFDSLTRPALIAHRGASAHAPENTLAAFRLALAHGADAIELDTMLCRDAVVVIHDHTLERTTNGAGRLSDKSLGSLKELDAGGWFAPAFTGEEIPTLDEVFETVGREILINIELKNYSSPFDNLAEHVALSVLRHNLAARVFFSSFNPLNFRKLKARLPAAPVGWLSLPGRVPGIAARFAPHDALHPHFSDVTPQLIKHARQRRLPVFAYTVNEAAEAARLAALGVDGMITDDPARLRQSAGFPAQ